MKTIAILLPLVTGGCGIIAANGDLYRAANPCAVEFDADCSASFSNPCNFQNCNSYTVTWTDNHGFHSQTFSVY